MIFSIAPPRASSRSSSLGSRTPPAWVDVAATGPRTFLISYPGIESMVTTSTAIRYKIDSRRERPGRGRLIRASLKDRIKRPTIGSVAEAPLLVGAAVARPKDDLCTVGGARAVRVDAQSGLDVRDGAVGVDVPLLAESAGAVPDDDHGAVGRAPAGRVQALVAVHRQLLARGIGPPLVRAAVAVPQLRLRAVGGRGAGHVHAAAGLAAHDLDVLLPAAAALAPDDRL